MSRDERTNLLIFQNKTKFVPAMCKFSHIMMEEKLISGSEFLPTKKNTSMFQYFVDVIFNVIIFDHHRLLR